MKHIKTTRAQFAFLVFDYDIEFLQESPAITEQNCPKVTTKTPKITGKTRVGEILSATTIGWAPADVQLSYQWYRSGKKVTHATGGTYTLTKYDKGKKITVKVTGAHDGYYSAAKTSKKTSTVKVGILATTRPVIGGSPIVGTQLTANPGAWGPAKVSLSYQWYRSGKKIRKATSQGYTPVASDFGKKLSVKVTGKLAGYTTVTKTSASTVKVTAVA